METTSKLCDLCGQIQLLKNPDGTSAAQIIEDMQPCIICGQNRPFPTQPGRWEYLEDRSQAKWHSVAVEKYPTGQVIVVDDADESKSVELEKMSMRVRWRKR